MSAGYAAFEFVSHCKQDYRIVHTTLSTVQCPQYIVVHLRGGLVVALILYTTDIIYRPLYTIG